MERISQSKVKLWRQCRFAYGLKYIDHLKPNVKKRPLKFGTIVHKMLEAHANGDDPFEELNRCAIIDAKLFAAEVEMYGDIVTDIRYIMQEYFAYYGKRDVTFVRLNGKNAEHKFEIEIMPGVLFTGKTDGFVKKQKSKLKWLMEHKTFKRKPTVDHRWRNIQSCVYVRAVDILGWMPLEGTLWDYIGSKPPTVPDILKNGSMSQRAIVTLPSVVKQFLLENNLAVAHYRDYLTKIEDNRTDYFDRVFTPIKKPVIDVIYNDFLTTIREMVEIAGKDRTRNIALHCDYCDYEPICRAALMGSDVDFVKEKQYHINEDQYDETPIHTDD